MLATLIGIGGSAHEQRSKTDQGDVIDLVMAGGKLADVLQEGASDGFGAAGGFGKLLDDPALVARVVEFFTEVSRVGHSVGEDGDDVSRIEGDLGLLVIALGDDAQGKAGDVLADLVDACRCCAGS